MNVLTVNILDMIAENGEIGTANDLSTFSCQTNDETDTYTISAFLLAQFGKNYSVDDGKRIRGSELMDCAMDVLIDIQHRIGGSVVYLDAEDRPKLISFYEKKVEFKRFGERYSDGDGVRYLQYMRLL